MTYYPLSANPYTEEKVTLKEYLKLLTNPLVGKFGAVVDGEYQYNRDYPSLIEEKTRFFNFLNFATPGDLDEYRNKREEEIKVFYEKELSDLSRLKGTCQSLIDLISPWNAPTDSHSAFKAHVAGELILTISRAKPSMLAPDNSPIEEWRQKKIAWVKQRLEEYVKEKARADAEKEELLNWMEQMWASLPQE